MCSATRAVISRLGTPAGSLILFGRFRTAAMELGLESERSPDDIRMSDFGFGQGNECSH